jgi:hypothetical protein
MKKITPRHIKNKLSNTIDNKERLNIARSREKTPYIERDTDKNDIRSLLTTMQPRLYSGNIFMVLKGKKLTHLEV